MRIGIDFDNTLAVYDKLFVDTALSKGWLQQDAAAIINFSKSQVRSEVRALDDGEVKWQILQATVYGPAMAGATLMAGVADFFQLAKQLQAQLFIVSHKTQFARRDAPKRYDLHKASLGWMEQQGFFSQTGFSLDRSNIFFTATRQEKVAKIGQLNCDYFIDDLIEVFTDPGFNFPTAKILIDPQAAAPPSDSYHQFISWSAIMREIFEKQC